MTNTFRTRTVTIYREDINNPLHDRLFDELCEDLDLDPKTTDELHMVVSSVTGEQH